jgi:hypothetical protein
LFAVNLLADSPVSLRWPGQRATCGNGADDSGVGTRGHNDFIYNKQGNFPFRVFIENTKDKLGTVSINMKTMIDVT